MKKNILFSAFFAVWLGSMFLHAEPAADPENYKPSPFANDQVSHLSAEMMGHLNFGLGLFLDYEKDPIVIRNTATDTIMRTVVGSHLTADILASIGLFEWVDIGVAIPAVIFQSGEGWSDADGLPAGSLGDIRLLTRVRLYRTESRLFALSLIPAVSFPTGQMLHSLSGASGLTFTPTLAMSLFSKWVAGGLNLFYKVQNDTTIGSVTIADQVGLNLALTVRAIPDVLNITAEFFATTTAGATFAEPTESPVETTLSVGWTTPWDLVLTVGGGAGVVHGFATPQFRAFAGLRWNTGFAEKKQEEAKTEEKAPEPVEHKVSETVKEDPKPEQAPVEPVKQEPAAEKQQKPVQEKKQEEPKQTKKTIQLGEKTAQPSEKKEVPKDVAPEKQKRSLEIDFTKKKEATVANAEQHTLTSQPAAKTGIELPETIYFVEESTEVKNDSAFELEKIIRVLNINYTLKMRIEGHADRKEKAELGLARAKVVRDWFIKHGIDAKRLQIKGFGAKEPVSNASDLDSEKAMNRRVKCYILEQ